VKYLQSNASKFVHGERPTNNPTMAARFIIGRGKVAQSRLKQYARRVVKARRYKGNPSLAGLASVVPGGGLLGGLLGGLGGRFKKPSEVRAAAVAPQIVAAANAGNLMAARGLIERAAKPMIAKESAVWKAAAAQLAPNTVAAVKKNAASIPQADQSNPEAFAASVMGYQPTVAPGAAGLAQYGSLVTPQLVTAVARAAAPKRARARYPTYTDRYGRQRYSTKPPGSQYRLPAGATASPGAPYSFFRGAVGAGGAAATVGQLAVAGAAGVAAYLVTQRVLAALGGRAQGKEEAGVAAALAFRQARADFKQQQGRDPNAAELKEMKAAYQQQLVELGYDPVTFTRERSRVEEFLETYNPLGG